MAHPDQLTIEQHRLEVIAGHSGTTFFDRAREGAEAQWNGSVHYRDPHIVTVGNWMLGDCMGGQAVPGNHWPFGRAALRWPFRDIHLAWANGEVATIQHLALAHQDMENAVRFGLQVTADPTHTQAVAYLGRAIFMGLAARSQSIHLLVMPAAPSHERGHGWANANTVIVAGEEAHLVNLATTASAWLNPVIDTDSFTANVLCDSPFQPQYVRDLEPLDALCRTRGALQLIAREMIAEYEGRLSDDGAALLAEGGAQTALAVAEAFRAHEQQALQPDS